MNRQSAGNLVPAQSKKIKAITSEDIKAMAQLMDDAGVPQPCYVLMGRKLAERSGMTDLIVRDLGTGIVVIKQ